MTGKPALSMPLEVKTERDTDLLGGGEFVRISYRPQGTRRWTRIAVFPDDGQPFEEVEDLASDIAEIHRGAISDLGADDD